MSDCISRFHQYRVQYTYLFTLSAITNVNRNTPAVNVIFRVYTHTFELANRMYSIRNFGKMSKTDMTYNNRRIENNNIIDDVIMPIYTVIILYPFECGVWIVEGKPAGGQARAENNNGRVQNRLGQNII